MPPSFRTFTPPILSLWACPVLEKRMKTQFLLIPRKASRVYGRYLKAHVRHALSQYNLVWISASAVHCPSHQYFPHSKVTAPEWL